MKTNSKNGFSLVELTFALMITGMGILAIFHVFPAGLEAGKTATADTRATEFAQAVFNSYRAEIAEMSREDWEANWDPVKIPNGSGEPYSPNDPETYIEIEPVDEFQAPDEAIEFPVGSEPAEYIRYKLDTELLSDNLVSIYMEVSYGKMSSHKKAFYTAIYYNEM